MLKRFLVILLAALTTLTVLAGCKKTTTTDKKNNAPKGDPAMKIGRFYMPKVKFNSDTVTFLTSDDPEADWFKPLAAKFEEIYKVKFKAINGGEDFLTKLATMQMSGEMPDIIRQDVGPGVDAGIIEKGFAEEVENKIDWNDPFFKRGKPYINDLKTNGKLYIIPAYIEVPIWNIWYNKKMFEEAGLDTPYELWKQGNWTWETMTDAAKQITVDKNGDGKIDQYGVRMDFNMFMNTTGKSFLGQGKDGKYFINLDDPDIEKAVTAFQKINNVDKLNYPGDTTEGMVKGELAMMWGNLWHATQFQGLTADNTIMCAPIPKYSGADKDYQPGYVGGVFMGKGSKSPEAAIAWAALSSAMDTGTDFNDPKEKENMRKQYADEYSLSSENFDQFFDIYFANQSKWFSVYKDYSGVGKFAEVAGELTGEIYNGTPFSTAKDKFLPQLEAALNELNSGK